MEQKPVRGNSVERNLIGTLRIGEKIGNGGNAFLQAKVQD
jgi:hypothetical protein